MASDKDLRGRSVGCSTSWLHQDQMARLEAALAAAHVVTRERDAAITQLEIKLNARFDYMEGLKVAEKAAVKRADAVEIALMAMKLTASRSEGLTNTLEVMRASMADERDRADKLVGVHGAKEEHFKLARDAADSARLELRNTVATIAAMSKERESFATSMQAKDHTLSTLQRHLDMQQAAGIRVVAALNAAKRQWTERNAKMVAQVKALKLQLASANDRADLNRDEAAAAAERVEAGAAHVSNLQERLQGAQAELPPLNAQLSRLAHRLDVKDEQIASMAAAAVKLKDEVLAANEAKESAVRATEELRQMMLAAQEVSVAMQQGQHRHLAGLKEQMAAERLTDVQNTEQRTEELARQMDALRMETKAEHSFTTRLRVALASAEDAAFEADERAALLKLQLDDARQLAKEPGCSGDNNVYKKLRQQFEKRYGGKVAALEHAVGAEKEAHRNTHSVLEWNSITAAAVSAHVQRLSNQLADLGAVPAAAPIVRRTIRMPGGGNHTVSTVNFLNKRALAMGVTDTTLQSARSDLSTYISGLLDDSISPRGVAERASSLARTLSTGSARSTTSCGSPIPRQESVVSLLSFGITADTRK